MSLSGVNNESRACGNHDFLREIALNSYGYGSGAGEAGGRGNIGLVTDSSGNPRVVKFNTSKFTSKPKVGTEAYNQSIQSSNALRNLLINIAQTSDLPEDRMKEVRRMLGLGEDNQSHGPVSLLTRKVTASVVKLIDKDIWTRVKAKDQETSYSTKLTSWSANEKSFDEMSRRIDSAEASEAFKGSAVALDRATVDKGEKDAKLARAVESAVEGAQKERKSAVSFVAIRTFEGAVQDAVGLHGVSCDGLASMIDTQGGDFLRLAAWASGQKCDNAAIGRVFAEIRKEEASSPQSEGLMRKTLANLLAACARDSKNLSDVTEQDVEQAKNQAISSLPNEGSQEFRNIKQINDLSKKLFGDKYAPGAFSRAFTTSSQRKDAIAILEKLVGPSGVDRNADAEALKFFNPGLAFPLIQKAVIEARKLQSGDEALTDKSIYEALAGKLPEENGNEDLLTATAERMSEDFNAVCGRDIRMHASAYNFVYAMSSSGLKYDSILEMLRQPGRLPTAHDFYDASIRPVRLPSENRSGYDTDDNRYGEILSRRVASRYFLGAEKIPFMKSADYYGLPQEKQATIDAGKNKAKEFMARFVNKNVREMVTDMLGQQVGEHFFINMLGSDIRYDFRTKKTHKYERAFRNYSDFRFSQDGNDLRLVVTPNRDFLNGSELADKDIDYEFEFLIDHDGNAWVTKQWVGHVGDKPDEQG